MKNITLLCIGVLTVLLSMNSVLSSSNCDYNISSCQEIDIPNSIYCLINDITELSGDCFYIWDSNITLDCNGYIIDGDGSSSDYGIIVEDGSNDTTIKNCIISDWSHALTDYGNYNIFNNNTFISNDNCIETYGILSIISNSKFDSCNILFSEIFSEQLLIYNNKFDEITFYNFGLINYWNITRQSGTRIYGSGIEIGGNYYTTSGNDGYSDICDDNNTDGFCDNSYDVGINNTDYLPLSDEYEETTLTTTPTTTTTLISGTPLRYCIDENNLYIEEQFIKVKNGVETSYKFNRTIPCQYGCSNQTFFQANCNQSEEIDIVLYILIGLGIILLVIGTYKFISKM